MIRTLFSIAVVGALSFAGIAYAGDPAPAAPAPALSGPAKPSNPTEKVAPAVDAAKPAPAASTEAPKAAEAQKAESPIHVMMGWIAKQVAPTLANPCPATVEGEKAWRSWFGGGKDIPLASLRDAMVSAGFDADHFVAFFQEMAKKASAGCDCADGKCAGGKCADGVGADAKGAAAPTGDAKPEAKSSCGGCKNKDAAKDAPKVDPAPAKPVEVAPKP